MIFGVVSDLVTFTDHLANQVWVLRDHLSDHEKCRGHPRPVQLIEDCLSAGTVRTIVDGEADNLLGSWTASEPGKLRLVFIPTGRASLPITAAEHVLDAAVVTRDLIKSNATARNNESCGESDLRPRSAH